MDLAPGAEHEPFAQVLATAVVASVRRAKRRQDFEGLRGTVGLVMDDTASALTLRFDFGRLTIHEGLVGIPTVTLRGSRDDIESLTRLGLATRGSGPAAVRRLLAALAGRRLKIYGLVSHPRFVLRLLRALSPPDVASDF